LAITDTELKLIAAAATIGLSSRLMDHCGGLLIWRATNETRFGEA
jgi:hypothetical protein